MNRGTRRIYSADDQKQISLMRQSVLFDVLTEN